MFHLEKFPQYLVINWDVIMIPTGKFFLDIGSEVPAFLCEHVGLEIDVSKVTDDSREWVNQQPTLFVSRSALKQHTSTMVHFSLNVNYIAQQASPT